MILAIDTSTASCSLALLDGDGQLVASRDEVIGRGHAERLIPMVEELVGEHVPSTILVGIGPGSFTGIRVGISAAHGLALGWDVPVKGMDSLALAAAGVEVGEVAVALNGGHGELFVREYARDTHGHFQPLGDIANLPPAKAAGTVTTVLVVGSGAEALVAARGSGEARTIHPSASNACRLASASRDLAPSPAYVRPPDAVPAAAA